jgi:hypothetical protein
VPSGAWTSHPAVFRGIDIQRISQLANASSAREAAMATVHGSLIRTVIGATDPERLHEETEAVEQLLREAFGNAEIAGVTSALVVVAKNP